MSGRIIVGDALSVLRTLPSESVHCVVTSPPYYGLRDYGHDGQIGLEATPDAYLTELVVVFREVRRVLRSEGTLWINLGDSYAGGGNGGGGSFAKDNARNAANVDKNFAMRRGALRYPTGFKTKDRMMIPARTALALQADGWWLRDEIIWHKPNPMPTSTRDRTTPAHEMLYMFAKSARYYYDMDAVKEPAVSSNRKKWTDGVSDKQRGHGRRHAGFNGRYAERIRRAGAPSHRHPRSVWSIPTRPFKDAHFATFPPDLARPCILAGCPPNGVVLDPFFGSGTVGVVAEMQMRDFVGIELNPTYADMAWRRILALESPLRARNALLRSLAI